MTASRLLVQHPVNTGPSPCDKCRMNGMCKAKLLACDAFAAYLGNKHWASKERRPTRSKYIQTLKPFDNSPGHYDLNILRREIFKATQRRPEADRDVKAAQTRIDRARIEIDKARSALRQATLKRKRLGSEEIGKRYGITAEKVDCIASWQRRRKA